LNPGEFAEMADECRAIAELLAARRKTSLAAL
jgi:hypothetical protein